jgi:integrase
MGIFRPLLCVQKPKGQKMAKWKCYKRVFSDTWIRSLKSEDNLQISDTAIPGLYMRFYPATRNKAFYLGYTAKGTKAHRNILVGKYGDFTLKEIRNRAVRFRQQVADGQDPVLVQIKQFEDEAKEKAKRIKVSVLLEEYYEQYSKVYKKPASQQCDRGNIDRYLKPILGDFFISELDRAKVSEFYNKVACKTSFASANTILLLLSGFWHWCERYNYLPPNSSPYRHIKKGKDKKKEFKPLDLEEYKKLLAAIDEGPECTRMNPLAFRALKVLVLTGCRTSEIAGLKKSELDLDNGFLYLEDAKGVSTKMPIGAPAVEELRRALRESPKDSEYLFPSPRGGKDGFIKLDGAHEWAMKHAGIRRIHKHGLRHSFISIGTDVVGASIQAVSSAIGHSNVATTEIYSHVRDKTRLDTANKIAVMIAG